MLGLPFFDPTRPPPPPPAPTSNCGALPLVDQTFVQTFLAARGRIDESPEKKRLPSISELKVRMAGFVQQINSLKLEKAKIEKEVNLLSETEWNVSVSRIHQLQESIETTSLELADSEMLKHFKQKLHARRKKRAWEKRKKAQLKRKKLEQLTNRKLLDDKIAEWQREQRALLDKEKLIQQQLDYASNFLADVHRRKAACKRHLAKFDKMKKQRRLGDSHQSIDDLDKQFDTKLTELTNVWTAKLADCIKEEKRLKDVLARRSAVNFQRRVENEWNRVLFGDTIPKKFEHPLLEADRDPEVLIRTRWAWDACLVGENDDDDEASSIPIGWVLPPLEPQPEWTEYRAKELI
ncbi:programmed cell death protein 7 [Malaya genurostris]|uniref:programmed cell death protein 7 n=1 Tax=Malaya genurostris TaxID=325434 RepID=UPI0026F3F69D|nr:programmed cell death protein 7 [Malaya genurostris]